MLGQAKWEHFPTVLKVLTAKFEEGLGEEIAGSKEAKKIRRGSRLMFCVRPLFASSWEST